MPKLVKYFMVAEFESVKKISYMDDADWKWREKYINFQGTVSIWESTEKFKGKHFISFNDLMGNYMHTGYGEYTISNNIITMTTRNSIYTFKILYEE